MRFTRPDGSICFGKIISLIVLAVVVIGILSWVVPMLTRPARTAREITERVFEGDNVLYNYEWFFKQYEAVQATKNKIMNAQEALTGFLVGVPDDSNEWSYAQQKEHERLNGILLGTRNILEDQVAEYNARAAMISRNIFKDWKLPDKISSQEESP